MDVPQKSIHRKTIDVDEDFDSIYYDNKIDNDPRSPWRRSRHPS